MAELSTGNRKTSLNAVLDKKISHQCLGAFHAYTCTHVLVQCTYVCTGIPYTVEPLYSGHPWSSVLIKGGVLISGVVLCNWDHAWCPD